MADVFVVSDGEYGIVLVADTLESALMALKSTYGSPYVFTWDKLHVHNRRFWTIRGNFSAAGWCTEHTQEFKIVQRSSGSSVAASVMSR
jgi:hypothetical protein